MVALPCTIALLPHAAAASPSTSSENLQTNTESELSYRRRVRNKKWEESRARDFRIEMFSLKNSRYLQNLTEAELEKKANNFLEERKKGWTKLRNESRQNECESVYLKRLEKNEKYQQQRRLIETPEEKEIRLTDMRLRMRKIKRRGREQSKDRLPIHLIDHSYSKFPNKLILS